MLSKDDILNAVDLQTATVDVPEWGGEVTIQGMTGKTREIFETMAADQSGANDSNIRAHLAALSIVDENGDLMFSEDDVKALGEKSYLALDRVFKASQKLNALDSVEEIEKN